VSEKRILTEQQKQEVAIFYRKTLSVVDTAKHFSFGKNFTRKLLKDMNVLLTISQYAKLRTGEKNSFFNKKHNEENKKKHSEYMKSKLGKLNPNYKHGKYIRRPRDFKIAEFKPIRNFVFNRDNYTCQLTGQRGGHLHAHHLLPYWVCPEAFFDAENIITVSTEAHFKICHNGDWAKFNADLISDKLLHKYSINRERLNELAGLYNKSEAIVRPSAINKTEEIVRNEQSVR
jgi:hypothetical protein